VCVCVCVCVCGVKNGRISKGRKADVICVYSFWWRSQYVCVRVFVIECKVKGTQWRGEGWGVGGGWGGAAVPKAIPMQTDTMLKLANGLHSVARCPICGPLFSGWYTDAPVKGTSRFQKGAAGWANTPPSYPSHPPILKLNGSTLILFTACFALIP